MSAAIVLTLTAVAWSADPKQPDQTKPAKRRGLLEAPQEVTIIIGDMVYTMTGPPIENGAVMIRGGKINGVARLERMVMMKEFKIHRAKVVTPGIIDVHCVVGVSGPLNYKHDQEQLEHSDPIQPELRAIDAYNPQDPLIEWVRSFGITSVHTGHAPGELISGQTMVAKTTGNTVEDAVLDDMTTIAATLGPWARKDDKSPGTRAKMVAMLREELIKTREYVEKRSRPEEGGEGTEDDKKKPDINLRYEALAKVLNGNVPLMITAERAQDIASALRLAKEFDIRIILDGAAECYLLLDEIKDAGVPVILHPGMVRPFGETQNASFETAKKLHDAGILFAIQGGYEDYVPKVRVALLEAAIAAANGLSFEDTLAAVTINPAKILGIDKRVGSLETGKDADIAMYDGDPFEYTTHCTGVFIDGKLVSDEQR